MRLRFIGQYTGGRTSIRMGDVVFEGRDPADVPEGDLLRRLKGNPEFEAVDGEAPRKRGRKPKA